MHNNDDEGYEEAMSNREMLKLYLDTFFLNYENVADQALDKAIDFQREVYKKHRLNLVSLSKRNIKSEEEDIQTQEDRLYVKTYLYEVEAEVFALYELKIMYAYKYFEIRLKELSKHVFNDLPDKDLYLNDLEKFYKNKNLGFSKIDYYYNVNELRRVNNSLKHSGHFIGQKIRNIPEFTDLTYLQIGPLKKFYERVQNAPKEFVSALASAIYDHLFKNDRYTDISKEFDIQDNALTSPF